MVTSTEEIRRPALDWLVEGELSAIIGEPGIGKSSLLRYVLLDLLSPEPRHEALAIKWGNRLPVWIPFAMWTRLVAENESACSLSDVLVTWLRKVCAPEDLITLVQQALNDSRLLLFVDGLDEWSNETAARSTVAFLEQFVGEREIPAIATSRPLGFERLGGLSGRWRRAKLAGLTRNQQCEFAYRWFHHQARASRIPDSQTEDQSWEESIDRQAKVLIEDIQRDVRLIRLAEVPLLLSGLIALSAQRVRLPRSRFKAYEELTRLLLQEQPQRREKAAQARASSSQLSQETRERALARLAYAIHEAPGSEAVDKASARDLLSEFLGAYLRKTPAEALELADQMLTVGAETVGILVEKSPQEVGFPHRAFQEFLVARHLSNLPFDQQKMTVANLFANPQWHEVFLCLCHLNTRTGEVDELVDVVADISLPLELEPARQTFLAEVAFGDLHCSAPVASKLARQAFIHVETGTWMPLRERLLEHSLNGLMSDVLRDETEARILCWYPDQHRYRSGVYQAMATWPREPDTLEGLWRGLFDENAWNQRAAAEALAQNYGGDVVTGNRLIRLLLNPAEPRITAFALHAVCLGWPRETKLSGMLREGRQSADWTLRTVAINHRVKRREHDLQDREILLQFTKERGAWRWMEDVVEALVSGWPNDAQIKSLAIKSLFSRWAYEGPMCWEFAGHILTRGFTQDDEAAEAIAELFRQEAYPAHRFGFMSDWTPLIQSFQGHPLLRDAVDDWMEKNQNRLLNLQCCLLSKSLRAKKLLLKPSEKKGVITQDQACWLLKGWGMSDPEAAEALLKFGESQAASTAAHLLPHILADKDICRRRLLNWLQGENDHIAQLALMGLVDLGCDERDTEVAEAAIAKFAGHVTSEGFWWGVSNVIAHFPHYRGVRELALHQIKNRGGDIAVVAHAYKDDPEIRHELLKRLNPLPSSLRLRIVDNLARQAPEDDFAHDLLLEYDNDTDVQIKTSAAIGYARAIRERGEDQASFIEKVTEGIQAIGLDLHERRQAAFAGLLELDRLDIVINADKTAQESLKHIEFSGLGDTNHRLASHLAKHWGRVKNTFGATFWERIGYIPNEFLEEIAFQINEPDLIEKVIDSMQRNTGVSPCVSALHLRSDQWRGTDQLRRLCLDLVTHFYPRAWIDTAPGILAAEIISEQFADDVATRQELEHIADRVPNPSALIIALCGAWPESPVFKSLLGGKKEKSLLLPAQIYLACCFSPPKEFVERLGRTLPTLSGDIWEFLPSCIRPILSRFERDALVRDEAFHRLEAQASPADKANLALILHRTDTRIDRIREWCRQEFRQQTCGEHIPDFALDIFSGRVRPVGHILLELLTS